MKVGDKVIAIAVHDGNSNIVGASGIIRRGGMGGTYGVEFSTMICGHNLGRKCKHGYGWNIPASKLRLLKSNREILSERKDK